MQGVNKITINQATMCSIIQQWYNATTTKRPSPKVTKVKKVSGEAGSKGEFEITLDSTPEARNGD